LPVIQHCIFEIGRASNWHPRMHLHETGGFEGGEVAWGICYIDVHEIGRFEGGEVALGICKGVCYIDLRNL
jgi:hypothetical protein